MTADLIGTHISKEFPGHGQFDGVVINVDDGLYQVEYSDGDKEDLTYDEVMALTPKKRKEIKAPKALKKTKAPKAPTAPNATKAAKQVAKKKKCHAAPKAEEVAAEEEEAAETPEEAALREHAYFIKNYVNSGSPLAKTRAKQLFCLGDGDFDGLSHSGWDNAGYANFKVYGRATLVDAALRKHGSVLKFTEKRLKKLQRKRKKREGAAVANVANAANAKRQKQQLEDLKASLPDTDGDVEYADPGYDIASDLNEALREGTEYDWRRRSQIHKIISKYCRVRLSKGVKQALTHLSQGRPTACRTVLSACTEFCIKKGPKIREHEPVDCFQAALPPLRQAWRQLQEVDCTASGSKYLKALNRM